MPKNKGAAYRQRLLREKARQEAFKVTLPGDESDVTYIKTLVAYVFDAIDKTIKGGLHFQYARVKEVVYRTRSVTKKQWEIRSRGRIYLVTVEDVGKITGVSRDDIEYGGPPIEDEGEEEDMPC